MTLAFQRPAGARLDVLVVGHVADAWLDVHLAPVARYTSVADAVDALAALEHGDYQVVLLLTILPTDPLDAFALIRSRRPEMPVVMLSANADDAIAREAIRAGAEDYLPQHWSSYDMVGRTLRHAIRCAADQALLRAAEHLLQGTLDAMVDRAIVIDDRARIVAANAAWRRWLRRVRPSWTDAGLGMSYPDVLVDLDRGGARDELLVALHSVTSAGTDAIEHDVRVSDGADDAWDAVRIAAFPTPSPRRLLVTHRDVTVRRATDAAAHRAEREMRAVFDGMSVGVLVTVGGIIRSVNRAFAERLGRPIAEIVGGRAIDLVHPDDHDVARHQRARLARGEPTAAYLLRLVRGDGGIEPVSIDARPVEIDGARAVVSCLLPHDAPAPAG